MPVSEFLCVNDSFQGFTHVENQDGVIILNTEQYYILAVFDGVSLSKNPKKGVEHAIQYIHDHHHEYLSGAGYELAKLMIDTNTTLVNSDLDEPLCTYCIAVVWKNTNSNVLYSNLGDSRIYGVKGKEIHTLTTDDIIAPGSSVLTRCLGLKELSSEDFKEFSVKTKYNYLLLCTDGFYNVIENGGTNIPSILLNNKLPEAQKIMNNKIEGANPDDATYCIFDLSKVK